MAPLCCAILGLLSWSTSSLVVLSNGGKSSEFPGWVCARPLNWPDPFWLKNRKSSPTVVFCDVLDVPCCKLICSCWACWTDDAFCELDDWFCVLLEELFWFPLKGGLAHTAWAAGLRFCDWGAFEREGNSLELWILSLANCVRLQWLLGDKLSRYALGIEYLRWI